MKNLIIVLALVCFLSVMTADAQVGVQAGAVASTHEAFIPYDSLDKISGAIGFTFGVVYKYWLTDHISLQPALNIVNKRWWEELDDNGTFYITRVSLNYLELPVQVVYTTKETRGFFAGIGPSLMLGLVGKRTVTEDDEMIEDDKIEFGSKSAPEKKMTIAVNAMAGYAFKRFMTSLNFSKGISNQPVGDADHGNVSNLTLRISVFFGKQ